MSEFFRRMSNSDFFLQNTLYVNVLFSGCTSNVIYLFFAWHKKFAQNPENCALDGRRSAPTVFSCFHQYSGHTKKRETTGSPKKFVNFDKMSKNFSDDTWHKFFYIKTFLVCNCVFKGIREKPEFYFLVDMCSTQKICTKSRKLRTRQSEVRTAGFFLFSSILRAGKKVWVDEFDKKKLWISTKCPTFSDKVFFEIFSCTHFFPNFSEKPSWSFLVKITFSGHFSFFTKSSLFFFEKIVIFFDFFSKKKFAKKHKKTWFCKKCVGRFQGRLQKVQKKTWEKSGFLLF